ncbi:MAG: Stp1/IreP family PP2C-type Ser/Thr phosphatase [bacterium]|nr:serine/threonine protein phosphatase [Deltaproteobacteria bacterium]MCP4903530.1 Stp1/IreP family PP2C-type Ser/Thr phosphatase [bacterium]
MISPPGQDPEASIQLASGSDVGQLRSANEDSCDSFTHEDGTRLLVLADGMGGARGGATASHTAIATIAEHFERDTSERPRATLETAIQAANARIFEIAQRDPELEGMGTTVVALLLDARLRATVAHVGDSRAYRYRRGFLEPITTDHSVVAEMQRRGLLSADEAAVHPRRNEILRAVGVLAEVEVEIADVDIAPGDRFVLCSDGLSGVVRDDEIAAVVRGASPQDAVTTLIQMANERGGPDNITVQILSIPAKVDADDPEDSAPVELSAIENERRNRRRAQRAAGILAVLAIGMGAYFLWHWLAHAADAGAPANREGRSAPPLLDDATPEARPAPTNDPSSLSRRDRFELKAEAPRRGIRREATRP